MLKQITPEYVEALRREVRRLHDAGASKDAKLGKLIGRLLKAEAQVAELAEQLLRAAGVERVSVRTGEGGFVGEKVREEDSE